MITLFMDSETTGMPDKNCHWSISPERFPFVVQLAWQVYDDGIKGGPAFLIEQSMLVQPQGYSEMPKEAQAVHGIDYLTACRNGFHPLYVFRHFILDAIKADRIVGHNVYFDISICKAHMLRLGIQKESFDDALAKEKRIDTMREGLKLLNGTHAGGNKWPKLIEIYRHLFNEEFDGAHDALNDVQATSRIYFELKERGIIN